MPDEIDTALAQVDEAFENEPTLVGCVIDRSGSMFGLTDTTIKGFNEFLSEQRKHNVQLILTLFDTTVDMQPVQPIDKVADFTDKTYVTGGMTALYDAIGTTINEMDRSPVRKKVLCIITDGEENQSKEYTADKIKDLLTAREEKWDVLYLGANQDAFATANLIGVSAGSTANYAATYAGTQAVHDTMSSYVTRSVGASLTGSNTLTDEEVARLKDEE